MFKCCQHHWNGLRKLVEDAGLLDRDNEHTGSAEPYDAYTAALMVQVTGTEAYRPLLAVVASVYSYGAEVLGPHLSGLNPDHPAGFWCPLCIEAEMYRRHVAGECTDPNCKVTPEDVAAGPWDEQTIKSLGLGLMQNAHDRGAFGTLQ